MIRQAASITVEIDADLKPLSAGIFSLLREIAG